MSRPRVALIFSGQPRCVDGISYQSFLKCILSQYDVDVYAHFWGDVEPEKSSGTASANIQLFQTLYKPKAIQVDPPLRGDEFPLPFIQPHSPVPLTPETICSLHPSNWAYWVRNCVSMYTSMDRAYTLFEAKRDRQYDWILRTRTDCVLLRCPRLDILDRRYMYVPNWRGPTNPVIVNHALFVPTTIAPVLFRIRHSLESLPGNMDEAFIYNHMKQNGLIDSVRTLPMSTFYPTLTRNGINTDKPEPNMTSTIVFPPYIVDRVR